LSLNLPLDLDELEFYNPWHTFRTLGYGDVRWDKNPMKNKCHVHTSSIHDGAFANVGSN